MTIVHWDTESKRALPVGGFSAYWTVIPAEGGSTTVVVRQWVTAGTKTRLYKLGDIGFVRKFICRTSSDFDAVEWWVFKLNIEDKPMSPKSEVRSAKAWETFRREEIRS